MKESIFEKLNEFLEGGFVLFDNVFHSMAQIPHYINLSLDKINYVFDGMPDFVIWSAIIVASAGIIQKISHYGG